MEIQNDFIFRVNHEWGTATAIDRGFRRALHRITLHAGGFSGLVRRKMATTVVFCETANVSVECSNDRGETITAKWLNPNETATIPPGVWFRLVAPEKPAAVLMILSGIVVGKDFDAIEAGGVLPMGGTRRTSRAA